jgi:hypothetical protein
MDVGHKGNAGAITYKPSTTLCSCKVYPHASMLGLVTIQMLPASECPENNQPALFRLEKFLMLNSYKLIRQAYSYCDEISFFRIL